LGQPRQVQAGQLAENRLTAFAITAVIGNGAAGRGIIEGEGLTMEIAYFVIMAVGTFVSVISLAGAAFSHWRKKQDRQFEAFREAMNEMVREERENRRDSFVHLRDRMDALESRKSSAGKEVEGRLSRIEGELKGIRTTMDKIQQWFIDNAGGK